MKRLEAPPRFPLAFAWAWATACATSLAIGCRDTHSTSRPPRIEHDAAIAARDAGSSAPLADPVLDAAAVGAAGAAVSDAAGRVDLPPNEDLTHPFRGTNAHGFVAISSFPSNGGAQTSKRSFIAMPAVDGANAVLADRPVLVASFTKLLTAVATLRMVERGELSLDETIKTALPELASRPWSDSTIRELLTHTSRVPEFDERGGYYRRADIDVSTQSAVVSVLLKYVPADFTEKRGVYKYRNAELAIVGAILAARAKSDAESVLRREVFEPAKMTHAGLLSKKAPTDLDIRTMGSIRPQNFFTAGAGYASASDLLSFFEALDSNVLLRDDSKKTLFDGRPERNHGAYGCWAFPFGKPEGGTTTLVERPGTFGNVRFFSAYFPEEHRAIIAWTDNVDIARPRASSRGIGASLARAALE